MYLCLTHDKMIKSNIAIFTIVIIVQIVSFANGGRITKVDLNRSVVQLVKARDGLEKIAESLKSKQLSAHLLRGKFTILRGDLEVKSTSDSLIAAVGKIESQVADIANNMTIGGQIIKNQAVKTIDVLIEVMNIDSDSSVLDEEVIKANLHRSLAQLSEAHRDLEKLVINLQLRQCNAEDLEGLGDFSGGRAR